MNAAGSTARLLISLSNLNLHFFMVPFVDDRNLIAAFEFVFDGGLAGMPLPAGEPARRS